MINSIARIIKIQGTGFLKSIFPLIIMHYFTLAVSAILNKNDNATSVQVFIIQMMREVYI
ncbi:hypothetical protein [Clostridium gasigenes]|uniref:hypothetical protein n=1 Tax=Clostridium gasigenes TaxID=94869 RepID=UPI001C0BF205|nr:hypothetical protein [Clostridium gasigenes]MBU3107480.1 hypothetical protein [Clostridium gasigenes]